VRPPDRYCPRHQPTPADRTEQYRIDYAVRGPAHKRGYDAAWTRARNAYIAAHPLCEMCLADGRVRGGEIVDHIVPLSAGGQKFDTDNLQTLCRKHHAVKTLTDKRGGVSNL